MILTLISGLSGSGKTTALKSLEDNGFYCIDNLPLALLSTVCQWHGSQSHSAQLAISIDARTQDNFTNFAEVISQLAQKGWYIRLLFLESRDAILLRRFSETRRNHPLSNQYETLEKAIYAERELLYPLKEQAHIIDTSDLLSQTLRLEIQSWLKLPNDNIIITFETFGFKYGVPTDIDYLFDVRCLPNPYYDSTLREQTGYDSDICQFFEKSPEVGQMIEDIEQFIRKWLPALKSSVRHYLTVGIGCTGGYHRSVYVANQLHQIFRQHHTVRLRHRQLPTHLYQEKNL